MCHAKVSVLDKALRIRAAETELIELFRENKFAGTIHTAVGQELGAVALGAELRPGEDAFFGSHRSHGHLLAQGAPLAPFFAEILGREGALCLGRGGSQNLHYKRFWSSGIQGGTALMSLGCGWACKLGKSQSIAVAQIGDGTLGEGALYEALTFAAVLELPVLFFLEWNGYAQSTDVRTTCRGDVAGRLEGFGVTVERVTDQDYRALSACVSNVVAKVRQSIPHVLIVETRRLLAHSTGDDFRSEAELARLRDQDPLTSALTDPDLAARWEKIRREVSHVAREVLARPLCQLEAPSALPPRDIELRSFGFHADLSPQRRSGRISAELNETLSEMMEEREDVVVLGEDVADPYGGAFRVTKGLSSAFPSRVFSSPIAEAALVGLGNGLALSGYRPVVEIMFSDFATLASDQLINHAAKMWFTYGSETPSPLPLTIRLVSGAGRGYGPTHSQSLESLFCGVPGLRVLSLSHRHDPRALLREVVLADQGPALFVEPKVLYPRRPASSPPLDLLPLETAASDGHFPPLAYTPPEGVAPGATLVTCGSSALRCEAAMRDLFVDHELSCDYFIVTQLWPLSGLEPILSSVRHTGRLVVVEEGYCQFGLGAAISSEVCELLPGTKIKRVGLRPIPIPCARHLEEQVMPAPQDIVEAVAGLVEG